MTTQILSPQRRRRLSSYLVLAFALVLLGGAYSALAPSGYAQETASTDQITQGKALFSTNCATCHGMDAKGGRSGGVQIPDLTNVGAAAVDFQVGTGRMPLAVIGMQANRKAPKFSEAQIQALAAYVGSLGNGPAIPGADKVGQQVIDAASVSHGAQIFSENCAQCHNIVGKGGALTGGQAAPTLQLASNKQIWEALATSPGNMPSFYKQLNDADKADVIKYVTTIRSNFNKGGNDIGRLGPVPEGALGWVLGVGGLVVCCVWIGSRI